MHGSPLIWSIVYPCEISAEELVQWFCRHIHIQTSVLFRLISILLFGLEIFTSFHTHPCLHGGVLGVPAFSWHLTNMRDGGRITTRVWNRSRSALAIVNSAGSEIARFICDTAVHHPMRSVFLILHQSELLRTASDNSQQIPAPGAPGAQALACAVVLISTITGRKWRRAWYALQVDLSTAA